MSIAGEQLSILFKTGKTRVYYGVPVEVSYGLLYSKTPVKYFNEKIKGNFTVEVIEGKK